MRFLLAFLLLGSVALPAEIDDDFASMVLERFERLEKRVDALEGKGAACPCPTGGKCICPADGCNCPGCPLHRDPDQFLVTKRSSSHAEDYSGGKIYVDANKLVLRLSHPDGPKVPFGDLEIGERFYWSKSQRASADDRIRILAFSASWCANCPAAERDAKAAGLWNRVVHYNLDKEKDQRTADKLGVTSLPALLLVKDEKVIRRISGATGYADRIKQWLDEMPALAAAKTKDDCEPVRIARTSPAYSYGSTGYNPVQRCTVSRLNPQRWTWPGDLGSHLRSAHGFNPSGFTHSQLVTIHDNFHNTGQSGVSSGGYSRSPVVRFSAPPRQSFPARVMQSFGSFCPTCPR